MANFFMQQNSRKIGVVIGITAFVGIACLAYKKIKKHMQPRMLCCRCITDEEIDALLMQAEDFGDWGEDDYE